MNINKKAQGIIIKLPEEREIAIAWNGKDLIEWKIKCKAGDWKK